MLITVMLFPAVGQMLLIEVKYTLLHLKLETKTGKITTQPNNHKAEAVPRSKTTRISSTLLVLVQQQQQQQQRQQQRRRRRRRRRHAKSATTRAPTCTKQRTRVPGDKR